MILQEQWSEIAKNQARKSAYMSIKSRVELKQLSSTMTKSNAAVR